MSLAPSAASALDLDDEHTRSPRLTEARAIARIQHALRGEIEGDSTTAVWGLRLTAHESSAEQFLRVSLVAARRC